MRKCTARQFKETAEKVLEKYVTKGRILKYEISDDYTVTLLIQNSPAEKDILFGQAPERTAIVEYSLDKLGRMESSHKNLEILDKSTLNWTLKHEDRIARKLLEEIHRCENAETVTAQNNTKEGILPAIQTKEPLSDRTHFGLEGCKYKGPLTMEEAAKILAENEGYVQTVSTIGKGYTEIRTYTVHFGKLTYETIRKNEPVVCGLDEIELFLRRWMIMD